MPDEVSRGFYRDQVQRLSQDREVLLQYILRESIGNGLLLRSVPTSEAPPIKVRSLEDLISNANWKQQLDSVDVRHLIKNLEAGTPFTLSFRRPSTTALQQSQELLGSGIINSTASTVDGNQDKAPMAPERFPTQPPPPIKQGSESPAKPELPIKPARQEHAITTAPTPLVASGATHVRKPAEPTIQEPVATKTSTLLAAPGAMADKKPVEPTMQEPTAAKVAAPLAATNTMPVKRPVKPPRPEDRCDSVALHQAMLEGFTEEKMQALVDNRISQWYRKDGFVCKHSLGTPEESYQQRNLCAYETLLMMIKCVRDAETQQQLVTFIQDVVRTGLQVPQKRHQKLKRAVDCVGAVGTARTFDLLRQVPTSAWDQPEDFQAWQNRQLIFLFNELASESNSLIHFMMETEKVFLESTFSELDALVQSADAKAFLSLADQIASMCSAIRERRAVNAPLNDGTLMPIEQTMIAILDMRCESNVWELMRSWIQGNSRGLEVTLLSTLEGFLLPECNEVIKQYIRVLCTVRVAYSMRGKPGATPGMSLITDHFLKMHMAVVKANPTSAYLLRPVLLELFCRLETSLEYYYLYTEPPQLDLLKTWMLLFLNLLPLFLDDVEPSSSYPVVLPIPSNTFGAHALQKIFHLAREHQYFRRMKVAAQLQLRSRLDLTDGNSGVNADRVRNLKEGFLDELAIENEKFLPIFCNFIAKRDLWHQVIEPRIQQFRAEVIHLVEYPSELQLKGKVRPTLDQSVVSILSDLHTINGAIYQLALILIGEDLILDNYPIPLFDLDYLVHPYFREWMNNIQSKFNVIALRCVQNDKGLAEDEHLNVSSAPADFFGYLFSVVEIFFSLPGAIHSGEEDFDRGSTDALSAGAHVSAGPQSPIPAHPLTPLRGVHRVLRENIVELCESMMVAVEKFSTLNIAKEYGVDLEDLSFEVFRMKLKPGMVSENHSTLLEWIVSRLIRIGTLEFYLRKLNNLAQAKHLLSSYLENKVKGRARERGGTPNLIQGNVQGLRFIPLYNQERDGPLWEQIFAKGHASIKRATIKLVVFLGKFIVYNHMKNDLIEGLYQGTNLQSNSIQALRPIITAILDHLQETIFTDQLLASESGRDLHSSDILANQVLLSFFYSFMDAYESIVLLDPQSGRKIEGKDAKLLMEDISIIEEIFTTDGIGLPRLPLHAVHLYLNPAREIISTLFPMDSQSLIRTYEKLMHEKKTLKLTVETLSPTVKRPRKATDILLEDIIEELEKEELKRLHQLQGDLHVLEEQQEEEDEAGPVTKSSTAIRPKRIGYIRHSWSMMKPRRPSNIQKDLPDVPVPESHRRQTSTNPFESDMFDVWQPSLLFNVLAHRVGYGNPDFYTTEQSGFFQSSSAFFSAIKSTGSSSGSPKQQQQQQSEEEPTVTDRHAYLFIKKHGMKRWLGKRMEKAESFVDKTKHKLSK